jgi:hypothetical protein
VTNLVDPQRFTLKTLGGTTLPASDKTALDAYVKKTAELERAYQGATALLNDLDNTAKLMRKATYSIAQPATDLLSDVKALEEKIYTLKKTFYGDGVAGSIDRPTQPSLGGRIGAMGYEIWSSSSAPTSTQKEQQRIAGAMFEKELAQLRQVYEVDLKNIERKLEAAKAPYTPGRMPVWKKD